ncbi:uncharacterized protein LOC8034649 [Ixodes scapularis]|uniref:uncharacterized protein LOC8034649 n=1 Tax=Ixodes scapularis TaxID=6945 RepID=UPI001C38799C|nr:uncharacterized protein LOC8034649 [Ixodes scapularis]
MKTRAAAAATIAALLGGCIVTFCSVSAAGHNLLRGNPASGFHNSTTSQKIGATSASWSFPMTSSFPSSTTSAYLTTASPPTSTYLKNHATTYSSPDYGPKPAGPSKQSQAVYTYYNAPSTTTTSTTPAPFAYNLPYNPMDYYFETKDGAKVSQVTPGMYKVSHGPTNSHKATHVRPDAYKVASAPTTNYYTSDYEDEEEEPDRHLSRIEKKPDYDSVEASPTYIKTKYGYTTKNPLVNDDPKASGLSRDGGAASFKVKDKVVVESDKNYATATSDHYDYKGYDYADFGYPDYDHGYPPYAHRHKHHSSKGPLALLLGLLPLGLLMAALVPSVINLPVAAVGVAGRRRRASADQTRYRNPILEVIAKFGVNSLEDPECLQQIFCEVTTEGKTTEAMLIQKVFYGLSTLVSDLWAERLGLGQLFKAVKKGSCDAFRCSPQRHKPKKPTKPKDRKPKDDKAKEGGSKETPSR